MNFRYLNLLDIRKFDTYSTQQYWMADQQYEVVRIMNFMQFDVFY